VGPLEAVTTAEMGEDYQNMGRQFHIKNPGKLGISLNVRDPRGLAIAKRLIAMSDVVAEGFSPGVLEKWGLGYDVLRSVRPDIIYVKQSGMGSQGTYGRLRTVGPIAAAFAGNSEQSGLPEPALPAGWGYSYLDWMGAYSFALAIISALYYRNATGRGQWIDASQCEAGLFVAGTTYLDCAANHRTSRRTGNMDKRPVSAWAPPLVSARSQTGHRLLRGAGVAGALPSGGPRRVAEGPPVRHAGRSPGPPGRAGPRRLGLDRRGGRVQGDAGASGGRSARRGVPDGRRSLRPGSSAAPPELDDRAARHQARDLAGPRGAGPDVRGDGDGRRADGPRRSHLRRGQRPTCTVGFLGMTEREIAELAADNVI
jgi:hypothetical protein